jgi:hypothetical protein
MVKSLIADLHLPHITGPDETGTAFGVGSVSLMLFYLLSALYCYKTFVLIKKPAQCGAGEQLLLL